MANRKISVDLVFGVDNRQAKAAIQDLNNALQKIQTLEPKSFDTSGLKSASEAAKELQGHLANAVNVDTGKLDLNRFSKSLKQSGHDLKYFRENLSGVGPEGSQAFLKLANSIATADTNTIKLNKRMQDFLVTVKNTAKWQISSNIMHGFEGALSSAYGYAQDLNKSLNDIRIVSGQSTDQMARFAKEANNAAKALSTSTLDYTNAALIYYQQGLTDQEILDRTEVTIKMANAAGVSAETVSDQLTAVWNNFYDGSKSLEYYADVMTALGAATASSTDEISDGINKFAAVADTVGLSYEYAASALATVTATTRQSADTVGTAFKTLFSRIQGLKLGETLEDGVNLNKYSAALESVGIDIMDQAGNLKDMDIILNEMGNKWNTISKNQQVALAQTVGGARQYTQLIALMDNWSFFQENLQTSLNAEGTLQEQADIYAESWEAAQKRVSAAAEEIYSQILDDEFFIDITNVFAEILNGISDVIDGMGGLKGVLLTVGSIFMKQYAKEMPKTLNNLANNFAFFGNKAKENSLKTQKKLAEELESMANDTSLDAKTRSLTGTAITVNKLNEQLLKYRDNMSQTEIEAAEALIRQVQLKGEIVAKEKELQEIAENKAKKAVKEVGKEVYNNTNGTTENKEKEARKKRANARNYIEAVKKQELRQMALNDLDEQGLSFGIYDKFGNKTNKKLDEKEIKQIEKYVNSINKAFGKSQKEFKLTNDSAEEAANKIEEYFNNIFGTADALDKKVSNLGGKLKNIDTEELSEAGYELAEREFKTKKVEAAYDGKDESIDQHVMEKSEAWTIYAGSVMQAYTAVESFKSIGAIWSQEDLDIEEKMTQTVSSLIGLMPMLTTLLGKNTREQTLNAIATMFSTSATEKDTAAKGAAKLVNMALVASQGSLLKSTLLVAGAIGAAIVVIWAIVSVIKALIKIMKAEELAQQRQQKIIEDTTKAYEDAKTAYDNLKASIEDYRDAQKALSELKKGAEGFEEALKNANDKALELIETYGLYDDWHYGENGEIIIDPQALEDAQKEAEIKAGRALAEKQAAELIGKNQQRERIKKDARGENVTYQPNDHGASRNVTFNYTETEVDDVFKAIESMTEDQYNTALMLARAKSNNKDITNINGLSQLQSELNLTGDSLINLIDIIADVGETATTTYRNLSNEIGNYNIKQMTVSGVKATGKFSDNTLAQIAYATLISNSDSYKTLLDTNVEAAGKVNTMADFAEFAKNLELENYFGQNVLHNSLSAAEYLAKENGYDNAQVRRDAEGKYTISQEGKEDLIFNDEAELYQKLANNAVAQWTQEQIKNGLYSNQEQLITNVLNSLELSDQAKNAFFQGVANSDTNGNAQFDLSVFSPDEIEILKGFTHGEFEDYNAEDYYNRQEAIQSAELSEQIQREDLDEDIINEQTKNIQEHTEALKNDENAAKQLAINNSQMNRGLQNLVENWEDWNKIIKSGKKDSEDYAKAISGLRNALKDLTGLSMDSIENLPNSFFESKEVSELLTKAVDGNVDAINELGIVAAKASIDSLTLPEGFDQLKGNQEVTFGNFTGTVDTIQKRFEAMSESVKNGFDIINQAGLEAGDSLVKAFDSDTAAKRFIYDLNQMAAMTGMSVEQMRGYLNALNLDANITTQEMDVTSQIPVYETYTTPPEEAEDGYKVSRSYTKISDYIPIVEKKMVAQVSYGDKANSNISIKSLGKKSISPGSASAISDSKGGSKSSSKKKSSDDEIERYHEIKEVIENVSKELDHLGKAKDRAWGRDKIKLIDQEIAKTKEMIDAQAEYVRQIEENAGPDRAAIAAYGAQFDDMGRISNYTQLMQQQLDIYNAAVATGNEDLITQAEENFENFKKLLEQYEETSDLLEDEKETLIDKQNELYDLMLEKVQLTVELKLEVNEGELEFLDYLLSKIEDDAYKTAESIVYLGEKTAEVLENIEAYRTGINDLFKNHGLSDEEINLFMSGQMDLSELEEKGFTAEEIQSLQDWRSQLLQENQNLMEIQKQIQDSVIESFRALSDEMQKSIDKMTHLTNITNSYRNLIDIVGKKRLGIDNDTLKKIDQTAFSVSADKLAASKIKLDQMNKSYADTEKAAAEAAAKWADAQANADQYTEAELEALKKDAEYWQDTLEEMGRDIEAAEEQYMASWEETLQAAADAYANAVDMALEEYEDKLSTTFGSLDALLEVYNQSRIISEQYLAEYKQIYELSKLSRDINNSISDIDNIKGKQELKELLTEIEEIQANGVAMSAYDLEYLQKRYDLRLAEIALEESQRAKSTVRMTKDSEGNWSYTYVADDSAVEDSRQNYEDKLYALQELSSQYLDDIGEQWIQAEKEWGQALASIYQDATLADEERQARIEATNKFYQERFAFFTREIEKATGNNAALYEEDWRAYSAKTDYQLGDNERFQTSFETTILGTLYEGIETIGELQQAVNQAILGEDGQSGLLGSLNTAYSTFSSNINTAMGLAGTSVGGFRDRVDQAMDNIKEDSEEARDQIVEDSETMDTEFQDILDNVLNWQEQYSKTIWQAISDNEALITSINQLLAKLAELDGAQNGSGSSGSGSGGSGSGNGGSGSGSGGSGGSSGGSLNVGTKAQYTGGGYYETSAGGGTRGDRGVGGWVTVTQIKAGTAYPVHVTSSNSAYGWLRPEQLTGYDTGGYTGAWGYEGKLAMLHEKEIVLNKEDTANFLSAIQMVRDITNAIDLNAAAASHGLGLLTPGYLNNNSQVIEQEITIHAEFPNATMHNEIEEAFNNLINTASQYANRKNL